MLRMSAFKTFAIVLAMLSVRAGDEVEIVTIPSLNINIASICSLEKVENFISIFYKYMYIDLTQNSNLNPVDHSKHILEMIKVLKESFIDYEKDNDASKKEFQPYIYDWFRLFVTVHYEAYSTDEGKKKFLKDISKILKENKNLKASEFDISTESITNLIWLYNNNIEYLYSLDVSELNDEEKALYDHVSKTLDDMKTDFYLIIDGIFEASIKRDNKSVISQTWFNLAPIFFGSFTFFKAFLGFDPQTDLFEIEEDANKEGLLTSQEFYMMPPTAKGPLKQQVLMHLFLVNQIYSEPILDDLDYLYMLRFSSRQNQHIHSKAFLSWLNSQGHQSQVDQNQNNLFSAEIYLFYIYLYISSNSHQNIKMKDGELLNVAIALKSFLLKNTYCYKKIEASTSTDKKTTPINTRDILYDDNNKKTIIVSEILERYNQKCYLEDFLDRELYIKEWVRMLELVYKIISIGSNKKIAELIQEDKGTIEEVHFFKELKISN